jgi:hypothetical protein
MIAQYAIVIVITLLAAAPALAESLNADAARRFVMGKLFAFNCSKVRAALAVSMATARLSAPSRSTAIRPEERRLACFRVSSCEYMAGTCWITTRLR